MDIREELKSAGVYPTGPVSAWPSARNDELILAAKAKGKYKVNGSQVASTKATKVKASAGQMAGGLLKTAGQALKFGRVDADVREERYDTCKNCPAFVEATKRCSECGCFMEAKTWVGGNPDTLCPLQKWSR